MASRNSQKKDLSRITLTELQAFAHALSEAGLAPISQARTLAATKPDCAVRRRNRPLHNCRDRCRGLDPRPVAGYFGCGALLGESRAVQAGPAKQHVWSLAAGERCGRPEASRYDRRISHEL